MFRRIPREASLEIREQSCTGCLRCVHRCHRRVLGIAHREGRPRPVIVNIASCKYCGKCARVCPSGAILLS